jgi:nitrate/TMAO reductase-like tetraheme cytochrome c subunit
MMHGALRVVAPFGLVLASALWIAPPSSAPTNDAAQGGPDAASSEPAEREGLARLVGTCKKCHEDVCNEWEGTLHAKSWTDPVFQAEIAELPDKGESCAPCHAPQELLLTGFGKLPRARTKDRDLGVNCVTCHMLGNRYAGPFDSTGHGGVDADEAFRKPDLCLSCHGQPDVRPQHDQGTSFRAAATGERPAGCQDCHMPSAVRKLVTSPTIKEKYTIGEQPCRMHTFAGARSGALLNLAALVEAQCKDEILEVKVTATTGHALPASEGRVVRLVLDVQEPQEPAPRILGSWTHGAKALPANQAQVLTAPLGTVKRAELRLEQVLPKVPARAEEIVQVFTRQEIKR